MSVKYPNITVNLTGGNGNAFVLLGKVQAAMQKAKVPNEEIDAVVEVATNGDYDHHGGG